MFRILPFIFFSILHMVSAASADNTYIVNVCSKKGIDIQFVRYIFIDDSKSMASPDYLKALSGYIYLVRMNTQSNNFDREIYINPDCVVVLNINLEKTIPDKTYNIEDKQHKVLKSAYLMMKNSYRMEERGHILCEVGMHDDPCNKQRRLSAPTGRKFCDYHGETLSLGDKEAAAGWAIVPLSGPKPGIITVAEIQYFAHPAEMKGLGAKVELNWDVSTVDINTVSDDMEALACKPLGPIGASVGNPNSGRGPDYIVNIPIYKFP